MRWSMLCFPHIFSGRVSHFILHIILVISLVTLFSFRIYFFEDSGTSEVWEQASGACISCSLTKYNLFRATTIVDLNAQTFVLLRRFRKAELLSKVNCFLPDPARLVSEQSRPCPLCDTVVSRQRRVTLLVDCDFWIMFTSLSAFGKYVLSLFTSSLGHLT